MEPHDEPQRDDAAGAEEADAALQQEQQGKGYGGDEGERAQALDEE